MFLHYSNMISLNPLFRAHVPVESDLSVLAMHSVKIKLKRSKTPATLFGGPMTESSNSRTFELAFSSGSKLPAPSWSTGPRMKTRGVMSPHDEETCSR